VGEDLPPDVVAQVQTVIKYAGYVERQEGEVRKAVELEGKCIPAWLDYERIKGLKTEARIKLKEIRPATIGQASRIPGVTPADLALLTVWMKRPEEMRN
jgi:tRNA uridine 5-carboxymethylaminomethyl modification enzyme